MTSQQQFEKVAHEKGHNVRKDQNGDYVSSHTSQLWRYWSAGYGANSGNLPV